MLFKLKIINLSNPKIKLIVNVDGIPIAKSSGSPFWPILGLIVDILNSKPFLIGIYHGHSKPKNANLFLEDFVNEILQLTESGLVSNGQNLKIELLGFVCDAPARAYISATKSHSGYSSCSKCIEEGDWEGKVVFLNENAPLRSDATFRKREHEDHHTGKTILERLPIDMVQSFPLDYMHLVCLGIMRKLLWAWIRGSLKCRIGLRSVNKISNFLLVISSYIPADFARKPRSLCELARWKATELRQFLLYTGPVVLKPILPKPLYLHFLLLHTGIKILTHKLLSQQFNDYAKQLLVLFVSQCRELYGKDFLSYNVHNLIHLADDVKTFGHLDNFCAFPFENHLQEIKKLIRKHDKPLPQVIRRIIEIEKNLLNEAEKEEVGAVTLTRKHLNGPVLNNCSGSQFMCLTVKSYCNLKSYTAADCCVILHGETIVKICNFVQNESGIFFVGQQFKVKKICLTRLLSHRDLAFM
ncbi:uncharacterized protein LOC123466566 [Daphnia magna]|uniref:uncharacterized protein LOC123466566 n=1 Tax=Daphnia magna TaxID=35525 RepID=UPI001E1BA914|nr:uncharacterized protein LOC123466566 [Daphnia magna]